MTETSVAPFGRSLAVFGAQMERQFKPTTYRKDNGNLVVQGQPVFRSGTFRDSMGEQNTWESLHMDQMVNHFNLLRNRGLLGDVPVRDGHPGFLIHGTPGTGQVVGWHTNLSVREGMAQDGSKSTYLLADYEFTDPEAIARYENKTYRNRSSEIGQYTTNDEATFWPTSLGFAWVDIPAVEGLNSASFSSSYSTNAGRLIVPVEKEFSVSTEPNRQTGPSGQGGTPSVTPPAVPMVQQPVAFSIAGQSVTDPVAVQSHITSLEVFQRETLEQSRVDFVNSLAGDGKIIATQIDSTLAFAKSLTPEQFANWKSTMEAAPTSSVLAAHGTTSHTTPPVPGDEAKAAKIMTLRSVVQMHKAGGLPDATIKEKDSYKELLALDPTFTI